MVFAITGSILRDPNLEVESLNQFFRQKRPVGTNFSDTIIRNQIFHPLNYEVYFLQALVHPFLSRINSTKAHPRKGCNGWIKKNQFHQNETSPQSKVHRNSANLKRKYNSQLLIHKNKGCIGTQYAWVSRKKTNTFLPSFERGNC